MSDSEDQELETISLETFKAWLSGVEEMQDEDWFPSKAQWEKIRQKIELIEEVVIEEMAPLGYTTPAYVQSSPRPVAPAPTPNQPMIIANDAIQPVQPPTIDDSALGNVPVQQPMRAPSMAPPAGPTASFDGSGGAVQTPNIDSSTGDYKSQYL